MLPAAFPNLLVNGASGIAVGMATNMAPHNLVEVIGAARHLIDHPDCSLDDLMRFVPGPDLPGGGRIIGLDGIRDAYLTGRGSFRTRATARVEKVTPRRMGIVVTELPYLVGPEKVIERVKTLVQSKKLQGISDVKDLTDRKNGLRLVFEVKNGFNPDAVLEPLYKLTPMEDSFGINNVALVDGQPRTLGLKDLLRVYVDFRIDVVRRRTEYRLGRRRDRLHLVEGLLIAILDIDEVIQLIRASDDAATAKARLISVFDLSEAQAEYILELQLRRLTKFSRIELETERDELRRQIEELEAILADEKLLRRTVSARARRRRQGPRHPPPHRAPRVRRHPGHRRPPRWRSPTTRAGCCCPPPGCSPAPPPPTPCPPRAPRSKHDAIVGAVRTTARGEVGLVTSAGRVVRLSALELPALPPLGGAPGLSGGAPLAVYVDLPRGEEPLTIVPLDDGGPGLALGTAQGVVKRVAPDHPARSDWEVIALKDGDRVVGAAALHDGDGGPRLRHQRRPAAPLPGLRGPAAGPRRRGHGRHPARPPGRRWSSSAPSTRPPTTSSSPPPGSSDALPGTQPGSLKVAPYCRVPGQGPRAPAASGRTGSCAARTPSSSPGPGPPRPARPGPAACPWTCPSPPAGATAPASPYPAVVAGIGSPVRAG